MSDRPLQRGVTPDQPAVRGRHPLWRPRSLLLAAIGLAASVSPAFDGWRAAGATETAEYSDSSRQTLASHFSGTASTSSLPANPAPKSTGTTAPEPAASSSNQSELPALASVAKANAALPTGGGSISSQAISLPSGPTSVTGMGESFTTQLSTGVTSFQMPFGLTTARGGAQPQLSLSYNSGGGFGIAGMGWSTGAGAITRQSDRGAPGYDDRDTWHPNQDRFIFGGSELVPICTIDAQNVCVEAVDDPELRLIGEVMPSWTGNGWQYFRARVEGSYLRFFWAPNRQTWVIQSKDGSTMELGVPLDGSNYRGGLQVNPDKVSEVYSWHLVRQYDTARVTVAGYGEQPVNVVVYRYMSDGNATYLSDIYDTTPVANPAIAPLTDYAHHTRLAYDLRPDVVVSYRTGWRQEHRLRLVQVDVSSKPFVGVSAPRESVRRYHLDYDPKSHTSLLTSVQTEGRCDDGTGTGGFTPIQENGAGILPASSCPRLPPVTLGYERVASTQPPLVDSQGFEFERFATQVTALGNSPPHSLGESLTGLMDINGDGLPDVVVTAPGKYNGEHAWFQNGLAPGSSGLHGFSAKQRLPVIPMGGVDAGVLTLSNPNVAPMDMDSDGRIDLVHMTKVKQYSIFSLVNNNGNFSWQGRSIKTASAQDVKIDFTRDDADIRQMDVNGDGLVDIVFSSPTEYQTFFALGRFPGGDGQFGYGQWKTSTEAELSTDPVARCAPWSATSIRFSDPDVQIADMNGDGFPDIVRMRSGQLFYWPGRGNGFWGTGDREDCKAGQHAENRHIMMANAPQFGVADPGALQINDINGDGYADLVEIRNDAVDIYLNDNGIRWTERFTLTNTPIKPNGSNWVQLTDIDGSGTPDILWGEAFNYRYIDLMGGKRPYVLTKVENGLGKTTELAFSTSTELMLQAQAAGKPWSSVAPTVVPVVTSQTVRDNLNLIPGRTAGVYVTQYMYRNPVFEGRQREFRGFSEADEISPGDGAETHTVTQRSRFLLGECPKDFPTDDVCSPSNHWKDNWREAIKGMPASVENFDEAGVYIASQFSQYQLKQLYTGLDGRRVITSQSTVNEAYAYDSTNFDHAATEFTVPVVTISLAGVSGTEMQSITRRATSGTTKTRTRMEYDPFGGALRSIQEGCVEGCPYPGVDETITTHAEFTRIPDASGWLWRATRGYVTGSINSARRNEVVDTFDSRGRVTKSEAVLSGTLPLKRFHSTAGAIAPLPPGASGGAATAVNVTGRQPSYDAFGNAVAIQGANGRCSSIVLDAQYGQFPVSETISGGDVGPTGCGLRAFTTQVTLYDRGMEEILSARDMNNQPSKYKYDSFGRLLSETHADPLNPGSLSSLPATTIDYYLPANPNATPYVITAVKGQDGATSNTNSYVERWSYSDGLGRPLGKLAQADPTAGDGGNWVLSGQVAYDSKGHTTRQYEDIFYTGSASSFVPGQPLATTKFGLTEYDSFGRKARFFDRAGTLKLRIFPHAQSVDSWDAADLQSGEAGATYASDISDGHGRSVKSIQRAFIT